jgi:plastocyanin
VNYVTASARYVINTTPLTSAVDIQAGGFVPANLNVAAGTTVTWTNNSGANRSVVSTTAPYTFNSGTIPPGGTYSYTFVNPIAYGYTSTLGGGSGTVNVSGSATTVNGFYMAGQMYRFLMTDTASGNGVELAYELVFRDWPGNVRVTDGAKIPLVVCTGSTSNYCTSTPHSAGGPALITSSGSTSISASNFTLVASNATPNNFGLFFYGTTQIQNPLGNGFQCVGGSTYRLPPLQLDAFGSGQQLLNFAAPPDPGGQITPGSSWNFQFWFRDPPVGAGFNFTNGLAATFCP